MAWYVTGEYKLNGVDIGNPYGFQRSEVEIAAVNNSLNNKTFKDIMGIKNSYILKYKALTVTQVNILKQIRDLKTPVSFEVNSGDLSIGPVDVHVTTSDTNYEYWGGEYRSDFEVNLTELN